MTMVTCLSELMAEELTSDAEELIAEVLARSSKPDWLIRKTDRARRLREQYQWLEENMPSLLTVNNDSIYVDLGCGMGEMLEIARWYGAVAMGVDALSGTNGMGDDYMDMAAARTAAAGLPVAYVGMMRWLDEKMQDVDGRRVVTHWTSRGSFEQMMSHCMSGVPHDVHHDCRRLSWNETQKTVDELESFFSKLRSLSMPSALLVIHANGAANTDWYAKTVVEAAKGMGWMLSGDSGSNQLHKFELSGWK